jgi:hypothetical protein
MHGLLTTCEPQMPQISADDSLEEAAGEEEAAGDRQSVDTLTSSTRFDRSSFPYWLSLSDGRFLTPLALIRKLNELAGLEMQHLPLSQ